jgi:hypothetical protein
MTDDRERGREELNEQKMMGITIEKNAGYSLPLTLLLCSIADSKES